MVARVCLVGAALLAVLVTACASEGHRPPVTYVAIDKFEPASVPASSTSSTPSDAKPPAPITADDAKDKKSSSSVNVSTAVSASASASAAPDDTSCYRKFANGCCGDTPHPGKMKGKKLVCPKFTVAASSCKGFGTSCEPR